jgi:hypothetical protein
MGMLDASDEEREEIEAYFNWQAPDLTVTFLQKVYSEAILGHVHDVWDIHTDKDRWWVITNPTNLYSQEQFPNLDLAVTFHIGLCLRVPRTDRRGAVPRPMLPFGAIFQQLQQTDTALAQAKNLADFQGIGVRSREALLSFIGAAQDAAVWGEGEPPKRADFKSWTDRIIGTALAGSDQQARRHLLRTILREAWDFANWLTHSKSATWHDAEACTMMVEQSIGLAASQLLRYLRGVPEECPDCHSPNLNPTEGRNPEELGTVWERPTCADCGWVGTAVRVYDEPPEETEAAIQRWDKGAGDECLFPAQPLRKLASPSAKPR